ncbi:MAG TPA: SOS response-associated peptidase family protein [Candidatus Limnocylindria bacterium]|nr:SOS response-associated peptidase family protein [Candidatus Limnocylindria bacterium]
MCGKYHVTTEDENISFQEAVRQLMLEHPEIPIRTGDILPSQVAPVYAAEGLVPARFGVKVSFMKSLLINARSETAAKSPLFKPSLRSGRCLVPARGFYEWTPEKKPHFFGKEEGGLVYMAGLLFPDEDVRRFVIITRDAQGAPARVHPRMPLIFHTEELRDAWLHQDGLAEELLTIREDVPLSSLGMAG